MIDADETLVRIAAPHLVAGIIVRGDRVILAAPILRYMTGWSADRVRSFVRGKGWSATVVREPNHPAVVDVLGKSP